MTDAKGQYGHIVMGEYEQDLENELLDQLDAKALADQIMEDVMDAADEVVDDFEQEMFEESTIENLTEAVQDFLTFADEKELILLIAKIIRG